MIDTICWCALLLLLGCISRCSCACTYPSELVGDWYSTSFGLLTFTSTSLSGFTSALSSTPLTFTCDVSSGTQYVSKTTNTLFGGVTIDTYICMNLLQISSFKYVYTLDSNRDAGTGLRFYTSDAATVTLSEACSYTDSRGAGEYELLVRADSITEAFITCPSDLLTSFSVVISTPSVTNCNGSSLEGVSSMLAFNYSSCVTGTLNNGGALQCLYSVSSDFMYVNLYNNDSSVDGATRFRFSCLIFTTNAAVVSATENPNACSFNQTATYVNSPGLYYSMTNLLYVQDQEEEEETNISLIVVLVVCSVVLIIIIVIITLVVFFKKCRKPKALSPPPSPKVRKRKRKPSITDYTPRISRADSIEKDLPVMKISTGEIITGTLTDRKALIDETEHKPPTKKIWQKKWETKLRPSTPIWSVNQMQKSTSLPENLDKSRALQKDIILNKNLSETKSVSDNNLRYFQKSHAYTKVPESTGKFGNSPSPRIQDSIISVFDTTLEPIRENPLSREATPIYIKHYEVASSARTDNRSMLSTAFTTSTLSARDINLFQDSNLRRSSRLSASNASIFDDPTWLNENSKQTDSYFNVMKNLIPGLPSRQIKDQKWFIKAPPTQEVSREDIAYFQNRNKRTVGINVDDRLSAPKKTGGKENTRIRSDKLKKSKPIIVRSALPTCDD